MKPWISNILLILCLLLGCIITAQGKKFLVEVHDVGSHDPDYSRHPVGHAQQHETHSEAEPFQKPGVIVPGLTMSKVLQMISNMYHAPTIKQSLGEGCRTLEPVLKEFLGEEMVAMTCGAVRESLKKGTHLETSDMCMMLADNMAHEQQEHQYSGPGSGGDYQGFDPEHDDGPHFNQYDQHQDLAANYPDGFVMNSTGPNGNINYGEKHFSPDGAILSFFSMMLQSMLQTDVPRDILEPIIRETFGVDPNSVDGVCFTAGDAIFGELSVSRTARDWMEDGIQRVLVFFGRITPFTCVFEGDPNAEPEPEPLAQYNQYDYTGLNGGQYPEHYQSGPDISLGMIVGGIFQHLGGFADQEQLCTASVAAANNFYSNPDELNAIANTMKTTLLGILETKESCVEAMNFISAIYSSFAMEGMPSIVQMIGYESEDSFCTLVVDAFDPASASAQSPINITKFMPPPPRRPPSDYPDYSGEPQPPPIAELIMIAARLFNAPTLSDALDTFCGIFDQTGQIYEILGPSGGDLCVGGRSIDKFQELCRNGMTGFSNHNGEQMYEDHGQHEHDMGMMAFYDHNSPLHGIMKTLAMRYGLFDPMNPYILCEAGVDIFQTPMQDLISLAKEMAAKTLSQLFATMYPTTVCMMDNGGTPDADFTYQDGGGGGSKAYDQEGGPGMDQSILQLTQLVAFAAGVEDNSQFCELITTHTGTLEDHENFLQNLATRMVNKVFLALTDSNTCTSMANIVYSISPEMVSHFTGKQSGADICSLIISAFNQRNSQNFQPPRLPDVSTIMESQEEPFQAPGMMFSFLSVENLVKLAGKLFNQRNPMEILRVLCSNYGKHLSQIPEIGDMVTDTCSMIADGEIDAMTRKCYQLAVPAMWGPEHPIALRTINVPYEIMKILLPLVNHPVSLEPENLCSAQEVVVNSDMLSIRDTADEILDGILPLLFDYGHGICGDMKRIYEYLKPKNTSCYMDHNGQFVGWDGSPCVEFMTRETKRFDSEFNGMFRIASTVAGVRNTNQLCRTLKAVAQSKDESELETFKDRLYSFLFEERQCANLMNRIQQFVEMFVPAEELLAQLYQITGFRTTRALCVETARLFNRKKKEVCRGIVDCAGVCNGDAVKDCTGVCMGPAVRDCAGECDGDAYENICGFCVGGRSKRLDDFGKDKCGVCRTGKGYRITTDCHGTCYGSAVYDKCGECVGGDSGRSENDNDGRIDCRGICDGGWVQDACGYCDPPRKVRDGEEEVDPSTVSKHMDCHGTCHQPGTRRTSKARLNKCDVCVLGQTGLNLTDGMNACDQCLSDPDADIASCTGCDGVAKSGKVIDACGVCGGDGSDCIAVQAVFPKAIQGNSPTNLVVYGAGFNKQSDLKCVFTDSKGVNKFAMTDRSSRRQMVCQVNLAAGIYDVAVERDGTVSESGPTLTVFQDTVIAEMTPTDIDLGEDTFQVYLTAEEDGAFTGLKDIGTPFIIAEGDSIKNLGERLLIPGQFAQDVDNELQFVAPVPDHSMQVHVWGSLDGINKLSMGTAGTGDGFPVTFWAEEPMFTKLQLSSNGASLTTKFDLRVAYEAFSSCDDIFQDTTKLGQGAKCIWKGPKLLKIVIGRGNDLILVGDELTLKANAVKSFGQDFSYSAEGSQAVQGPRRSVSVRARLFGTERITSCGHVRLTARKSKGGAGRDMTYSWSVSSTADVTAITSLLTAVTEPDYKMDGTYMDADTVYTFEVTVTNFLGSSDSDFIEVSRSATATPEVEIIPRGVDITNALVSEKFKLTAEITFYSDCVPPGKTVFAWSVDNDQVPLNLRTMNRRTLFVDANTLPGGANVTFTIRIYKESDPNNYVEQSIQITTRFSDLQTVIQGGNELTIGRDAGNVTIDGSSSFDPDDVAMDMTYEWLCEQVTDGTACWSYKIGEEGTFIVSDAVSSEPVLQFDALAMEPEKMYAFTLVNSKGTRSSSGSVNVLSMNGDPPRVRIRPIEGKVRSNRVFSLKARIAHTSKVAGYSWTTADTDTETVDGEAFAYLDLNDDSNLVSPSKLMAVDETHSVTFLSIKRGKLTPGSAYMFQLNVSTEDGLYGLAKVDIHILADVTSCSFGLAGGVNAYTELDEVEIVIENCAADDTAYPLTYQLFMENADGSLEAFTERQSEPRIFGIGKSARADSNTNTFIAKVCDTYGSCTAFTQDFAVTTKDTFTVEEAQELKATLVEEEMFKQNYVTALVNYNTISEKVDISGNVTQSDRRRRRAAASETSDQAAEQLEMMELTLSSTVMDVATAQLTIDQLSAIPVTEMTLIDQDRLLDVVIQLVDVFRDSEESISDSGLEAVLALTAAIALDMDPQYNAALFAKIETIEGDLSLSLLSQLVVGGSAIETVGDFSVTSIMRAIPTGVFHSKSTGGASINFGLDIASRFGADWVCSTGSCTGIAIHYDHFDTGSDFLSATDEDKNNRAADIISISLLDPESGETLVVEDLTDPVSISMTLTLPKDNSYYECTFWNATLSQWSTEGLSTVEHSATDIECLSTHLSQFTVMAQSNPTTDTPTTNTTDETEKKASASNTGALIGGVVGGITGLVSISVAIAFLVKKYGIRGLVNRGGPQINPATVPTEENAEA